MNRRDLLKRATGVLVAASIPLTARARVNVPADTQVMGSLGGRIGPSLPPPVTNPKFSTGPATVKIGPTGGRGPWTTLSENAQVFTDGKVHGALPITRSMWEIEVAYDMPTKTEETIQLYAGEVGIQQVSEMWRIGKLSVAENAPARTYKKSGCVHHPLEAFQVWAVVEGKPQAQRIRYTIRAWPRGSSIDRANVLTDVAIK